MYLYSVLGGDLHILVAPCVQSLSISAPSHVFVCGRYSESRLVCVVVGPGFVSTLPIFMKGSANHPAGPHGRVAKKCKSHPLC